MNFYNRCLIKVFSLFVSFKRVLINLFVPSVFIDKRTIVEPNVMLRSQYGGTIIIGKDCYISSGAIMLTHGGDIKIGNYSTINPYTIIYGQGGKNRQWSSYCRPLYNCSIKSSL